MILHNLDRGSDGGWKGEGERGKGKGGKRKGGKRKGRKRKGGTELTSSKTKFNSMNANLETSCMGLTLIYVNR